MSSSSFNPRAAFHRWKDPLAPKVHKNSSTWPLFAYPSPMSQETHNARVELDDALSTWTHRLSRYQAKQTTLNSLFTALNDVVTPAVSSVSIL